MIALAWSLAWLTVNLLILANWRRQIGVLLRAPVFRVPVLAIDSDDWGAGPASQVQALKHIGDIAARHHDATGHVAVINIAAVLAVPDGDRLRAGSAYSRLLLDAPMFAPLLAELRDGVRRGVLTLQLHGLEHYWPETLMQCGDPAVRSWLEGPVPAVTEQLPSHLQSRWVDAARLPSRPHPSESIRTAVTEEVAAFRQIFGDLPTAVVPPTFVWTLEAEHAWAAEGLDAIVTPGFRSTCRDAAGCPSGDEGPIAPGDRCGRLTYLVRNGYFEPARGRVAAHAMLDLEMATDQGHACLLESHRDSFIVSEATMMSSLQQLDLLYRQALARYPDLRFLSTAELARILRERDPAWLYSKWRDRAPFWLERLRLTGRPWKLITLTGLAFVLRVVVAMLRQPRLTYPA